MDTVQAMLSSTAAFLAALAAFLGGSTALLTAVAETRKGKPVDRTKVKKLRTLAVVLLIAGGSLAVGWILGKRAQASERAMVASPDVKAHSASTSSAEARPSLTLAPEVTDETGRPINRREAPFKIRVKGTATGVDRSYVYLVVDDSNAQWIEPTSGLGPNVGREFSGYCYLGESGARDSIGKLYKVFAVATNREYTEYEKLDRRTLQAESAIIELLRVR